MKKILNIIALLLIVCTANAQKGQTQKLDRSIRPSAAPAKPSEIPEAKIFTLSNGLKVFVVEDHRSPVVLYSLQLDIKPELEKEKTGIQSLFSQVYGTGTKTRSKEDIFKGLSLIGASYAFHNEGVHISMLKKYESKGLEIVSDVLINPVFSQEELNLNIEKIKSGLSFIEDDPSSINKRVSAKLTYGSGFPKGELETVKTIENITTADLENYHNTYFAPNVSRLVIVGDVTEAEAKANAEKYFGSWGKKNVPVAKYIIPSAPASTKVAFVEKEGAPQSIINITYPVDFRPGAYDDLAVFLMNHIFGGNSGRLFQNLREERSYTYGVYSSIDKDELVGLFSLAAGRGAAASIKAVATDSAIYQILFEMKRMINEPISEQELKNAKAYLAGIFGRNLMEPQTIAAFAINIDKYNLPKDYYRTYLQRLDSVKVSDIQTAAKKYLKPDHAWIVVVGDKAYADGLKTYSGNKTVQYYDMDGNPVEAPTLRKADIDAKTLINHYVEALGGEKALNKVKNFTSIASGEIMGQNVEMTQVFKAPDMMMNSIASGGMTVQKMSFDGKVLRLSGMGGSQEITEGEQYESIKENASICPEMHYAANGFHVEVTGIETLNNKDVYVLQIKKDNKLVATSYFDKATYLKVKSSKTVSSPRGDMQQIMEYGNYQTVDGIKFPYSLKQSSAGMVMEFVVKSVELNKKKISSDLFK